MQLELLDSAGEVMGTTEVEIVDDKAGDEPDVVGPFVLNLPAARTSVKYVFCLFVLVE